MFGDAKNELVIANFLSGILEIPRGSIMKIIMENSDEKMSQLAFTCEKAIHDESNVINSAGAEVKSEGRAEGIASVVEKNESTWYVRRID